MLTTHPLTSRLVTPAEAPPRGIGPRPPDRRSSVRYDSGSRTRFPFILAAVASVAVHGFIFLAPLAREETAGPVVEDTTITVALVIPEVAEIEDLDAPAEERPEVRFDYVPAPRQVDVPTIATTNDFVQALDFSSFVNHATLKSGEIVIPEAARSVANEVEIIFNLADLDRPPEIIFQPELSYPHDRKLAGLGAMLLVEFIVDENGSTRDPVVLESSDAAFDAPVRNGILRWRFRPGMKGGAKVTSRMRVPIEFRIAK
jgi:protein TonB